MSELEWLEIFGGNLKEIIEGSGYPRIEVADETGLSQTTISRYINGKQMPSVKAIVNLAYILNCDIRELMDFGDMID